MTAKKLFPIFILAIFSMIGWQGCTKTEVQKGTIEFGMNPLLEDALKSEEINRYDLVGALVTITGEDGVTVYDKEFLNFYSFGESFVTEKLKLETGHYMLSEFLLVDSSRNILWATPLEGSKLAYLVDDPLPINFSIEPNNTTQLRPEVVWVGNHHPGEFGYVNFDVEFVRGLCISVHYEPGCYDWYYDSIWLNDSIRPMLGSDFAPYFPGKLLVHARGELIHEVMLMPGHNKIGIPKGYEMYTITAIDCTQQKCFNASFGYEELKHFSCQEGEVLFVDCGGGYPGDLIITPEGVDHPTIEQGIFGRLMTTISDSICTEECQEECLWPVISEEIHLFRIDGYEDIWELIAEDTCNIFPLFNHTADVMIRTNSDGYFQAELEAGTYLYMVQTENGYYIDLMISYRQPGIVKIEPGEVNTIYITIEPCYY